MNDLAILIVSYNVRDLLAACLRSLSDTLRDGKIAYRIVVVDNASHDGTLEMLRADYPHVTVISSPVNVGFAGGNNLGLHHLGFGTSAMDLPRAVLLLNPDTVVEPGAISELLGVLDTRQDVVVVGPLLRYPDGTTQSSRRRFPSLATLLWESTPLEQWWPRNPWARRYHMDDRSAHNPQSVDWLVGAALLVRGSAIQTAGRLDAGFFMYSEELEWQQRIRRGTGGDIVYWPHAVIIHYEGKSSEQNLAQRHLNFAQSKLRYARGRWGRSAAVVLRTFLRCCFALQLLVESAKWLLGHKRPLRRARILQYHHILAAL